MVTDDIKFIKTTSSAHIKDGEEVTLAQTQENYPNSFIHVKDENSNGTVDELLYIGADKITDKFNLGNTELSMSTVQVGGLESTTFAQLKERSISDILIDMLTPIPVESITLNKNSVTMRLDGSSVFLEATILPVNVTDKRITWTSSDTSVATVSGGEVMSASIGDSTFWMKLIGPFQAEVIPVGIGETTITATVGGKSATCVVKVEPVPVEEINIEQSDITLTEPGETVTLMAIILPETATDQTVLWTSSDPSVVTVEDGVVTAVGVGEATVTASAGGQDATCDVNVEAVLPSEETSPSVSISYEGNLIFGTDEPLPLEEDITYDIDNGTWTDGTAYAGSNEGIVLTMTPDKWGEQVEEGTYVISGSVTFGESAVPVDNFGNPHPELQYPGETIDADPVTLVVVNPIYINDVDTITVEKSRMNRYLLDYRDEVSIEVTIPVEVEGDEEEGIDPVKFRIIVPEEFSMMDVKQFNPMTGAYDIPVDMVFVAGEDSYYENPDKRDIKTIPVQYKITLKK